jgi:hypothetical protein
MAVEKRAFSAYFLHLTVVLCDLLGLVAISRSGAKLIEAASPRLRIRKDKLGQFSVSKSTYPNPYREE